MREIIVNGERNPNYLVTECGEIYNKEGHKMSQFKSWNGYKRVKLTRGLKRGMYSVHRIVAETFISNPNNFPVVDHINDIRDDNRAENLKWCTNSYNQKKRFKTHKGTKRKKVAQINLDTGEIIKVWGSPIDVTRELGIFNTNISKVCKGERRHAGGYGWRYLE